MAYSRVKWPPRTRHRIWLLVDTGHARYAELITKATERHQAYWPGHALGVRLNLAETRAIIKIDGATVAWKDTVQQLLDSGLVLQVGTRDDLPQIKDLMEQPAWKPADPPTP